MIPIATAVGLVAHNVVLLHVLPELPQIPVTCAHQAKAVLMANVLTTHHHHHHPLVSMWAIF